MINEGARALLSLAEPAILTTINPDGGPQSSVMWFRLAGDAILMTTKRGRRKVRNLERDPRATIVVYDRSRFSRYVEVRATAEIVEEGAAELVRDLAELYLGVREHEGDDDREDLRITLKFTPTWCFYRSG